MNSFIKNKARRSIDSKLEKILYSRKSSLSKSTTLKTRSLLRNFGNSGAMNELNEENVSKIYRRKCEELDLECKEETCANFTAKFLSAFTEKSILLGSFCIGSSGFVQAVQFFYHLKNVYVIDLSMNHIEDSGAIELAKYLKTDPQVISIDLRSNLISSRGSAAIMESLGHNTHLVSIVLSSIDGINRNKIGLAGAENLSKSLVTNDVLSNLDLSYYGLSSDGCIYIGEGLKKNQALRVLDLSVNKFGPKGAANLFKCNGSLGCVESLNLARNDILDFGLINLSKQLMHNHTLRKLDLSNNGLTYTSLNRLLQAMQADCHVEHLSLSHNKLNSSCRDLLINFIRSLTHISSLDISGNPFKDECMIEFIRYVGEIDRITVLNIGETFITDNCRVAIKNLIVNSKSLRKLYLNGNSIGDETGEMLAEALPLNPYFAFLSFKNCELRDRTADAFISVIQQRKPIAECDFQCNNFSYKAFSRLTSMIEYNKQQVFSSVAQIAEKKINEMATDENHLIEMKKELETKRSENKALEFNYSTNTESFEEFRMQREKSIVEAKEKLKEAEAKYKEIIEVRKNKMDEFSDLKNELDRKERKLIEEKQNATNFKFYAEGRLKRANAKKDEANIKVGDSLSALEIERQELKDRLKELLDNARKVQDDDMKEKEEIKNQIQKSIKETSMKGAEQISARSKQSVNSVSSLKKSNKMEFKVPERKPRERATNSVRVSRVTLKTSGILPRK